MAKVKKKLGKNAKNALKVLADSKLLAASKAATGKNAPPIEKPPGSAVKPNAPNKLRPEKKRG